MKTRADHLSIKIKKNSACRELCRVESTVPQRSSKLNPRGSTVLSNQLYFNITMETKFPVCFYHSAARWACRLFAAEAPLHPHYLGARPTSCQGCVDTCAVHTYSLARWRMVFYRAWNPLTSKESEEEGRGEAGSKRQIKSIWRYQEVELERKVREERATRCHEACQLLQCSGWSSTFFFLLAQFIAMCNAYKGLRDTGSVPSPLLNLGEFPQMPSLGKPSAIVGLFNPNQ